MSVEETHHIVPVPDVGDVNVYVQGPIDKIRPVIVTVHDLGCSHKTVKWFVDHECMTGLRSRATFIHVDVPGQEENAEDVKEFPSMEALGKGIGTILENFKVESAIGLGEGAGANILARFGLEHPSKCLGLCLIHCTSTTAGFMEVARDSILTWKLDHIGMDPSVESYLVLHRFGAHHLDSAKTASEVDAVIKNFTDRLYHKRNAHNLRAFVQSFRTRTELTHEDLNAMRPRVLLVTGKEASFNHTVHTMYSKLDNKQKATLLEISDVANILAEAPLKLAEGFQYFLQGIGLFASLPLPHSGDATGIKSMSE